MGVRNLKGCRAGRSEVIGRIGSLVRRDARKCGHESQHGDWLVGSQILPWQVTPFTLLGRNSARLLRGKLLI
jgi:hypothetical protein